MKKLFKVELNNIVIKYVVCDSIQDIGHLLHTYDFDYSEEDITNIEVISNEVIVNE